MNESQEPAEKPTELTEDQTTPPELTEEQEKRFSSPAYDPKYNQERIDREIKAEPVQPIELPSKGSIFYSTISSLIVGAIFGVIIPLIFRPLILNGLEFLFPTDELPTQPDENYKGAVDTDSKVSLQDQITKLLAVYSTWVIVIALIYLFPIVYQLRAAIIYGRISQVFCLALTLFGPALILFVLPLWGEVLFVP